jgi:hypothetical protein
MDGSSPTGVAFYPGGGSFPASYAGSLFWVDYSRACIWSAPPRADGSPDASRIQLIARSLGSPVDLELGPGNDLYYADLDGGAVHRISYVGGSVGSPGRLSVGPANLSFGNVTTGTTAQRTFVVTNTGGAPITVTSIAYPGAGFSLTGGIGVGWVLGAGQQATVGVQFAAGAVGTAGSSASITANDGSGPATVGLAANVVPSLPPKASITSPSAALTWTAGQTIVFSGSGNSATGVPLPDSAHHWDVLIHHCVDGGGCHVHPVQSFDGVRGGSFVAPAHDFPSYLELRLTVTDANGTTTVSRSIQPRTVPLTFNGVPGAVSVIVGGDAVRPTPFTMNSIVGAPLGIVVPSPQNVNGSSLSLANGCSATPNIVTPPRPTTFTVTMGAGQPCLRATGPVLDDQVKRLYRAYFQRDPDDGGLTYWVALRRQGRTLAAVANEFARSAEFTARYGALDAAGFVNLVYGNVLGRDPDPGGAAYWVSLLGIGGRDRGTVMTGFSESAEFVALTATSAPQNQFTARVVRLYRAILQRDPDPDGLVWWSGRLVFGDTTYQGMAEELVASPEFVARYGSMNDAGFVDLVFANVLGRPADPAGSAYWQAVLAFRVATRGGVMGGFAASDEFIDLTGTMPPSAP